MGKDNKQKEREHTNLSSAAASRVRLLRCQKKLKSRLNGMEANNIPFGEKSRKLLVKGVNAVANAVRMTIALKGRNFVIRRSGYGDPMNVNDEVTVANEVALDDPMPSTGARLLQELASNAIYKAGDPSTLSTLMCQEIDLQGT